MNTIEVREHDLPDDLQAIAEEAARIMRRGIRQAAAHQSDPAKFPLPAGRSVEKAAADLLNEFGKRKPRKVRIFAAKSVAHLKLAPQAVAGRLNVLGNLHATAAASGVTAALRAAARPAKSMPLAPATVSALKTAAAGGDLEQLCRDLGLTYAVIPGEKAAAAPAAAGASARPAFTKLRVNLHRLKCNRPVGIELTDFAEDDIRIGGLGTDSTGQEVKMGAFKAGDFKRGERQTFPPRKMIDFDLTRQGTWPRVFNCTFLMGESDGSGLILDHLRALWEVAGEIVEELIVAAAMTAGASIGIAVGTAGGPVGIVIGAVVGAALGILTGFLFESLEDDIFDPVVIPIALGSASAITPGGGSRSGIRSEQFVHRTGLYTMRYEWELVP